MIRQVPGTCRPVGQAPVGHVGHLQGALLPAEGPADAFRDVFRDPREGATRSSALPPPRVQRRTEGFRAGP
jgi:hypothetical protein